MINSFKILLLGEKGVGKTSIVNMYVLGKLVDEPIMTIGANFMMKNYKSSDTGENFRLSIWDTAGQEGYGDIIDAYYNDVKAAIIVYDITDSETFEKVNTWIERVTAKNSTVKLVLVGNKVDLESSRLVTIEDAEDKATIYGMRYFEASALKNKQIDEIFSSIAEDLIRDFNKGLSQNTLR